MEFAFNVYDSVKKQRISVFDKATIPKDRKMDHMIDVMGQTSAKVTIVSVYQRIIHRISNECSLYVYAGTRIRNGHYFS